MHWHEYLGEEVDGEECTYPKSCQAGVVHAEGRGGEEAGGGGGSWGGSIGFQSNVDTEMRRNTWDTFGVKDPPTVSPPFKRAVPPKLLPARFVDSTQRSHLWRQFVHLGTKLTHRLCLCPCTCRSRSTGKDSTSDNGNGSGNGNGWAKSERSRLSKALDSLRARQKALREARESGTTASSLPPARDGVGRTPAAEGWGRKRPRSGEGGPTEGDGGCRGSLESTPTPPAERFEAVDER